MSGIYGNSLQFWAYDNIGCTTGGLCNPQFTIMDNGNVGIGTTSPQYKLTVLGDVKGARFIADQNTYADYVFHSSYRLRPLSEVEQYIQENHHLPEVPSAEEVAREGLNLGDNQVTLLKKIEELTLYVIEQNKKQEQQQQIQKNQQKLIEEQNLLLKRQQEELDILKKELKNK
jgi:hypothetical protein